MLSRWHSFLAFLALKVCEAAFVACLVLARTRKTKQAAPLLSQSSVVSVPSAMASSISGGAGTGAGLVCRLRQPLSRLSVEAATYLAALLEVRNANSIGIIACFACWLPGLTLVAPPMKASNHVPKCTMLSALMWSKQCGLEHIMQHGKNAWSSHAYNSRHAMRDHNLHHWRLAIHPFDI
jgi:hypothetical protein